MLAKNYCSCEPHTEEPMLAPENVHSEADLLVAAIYIDRFLMDAMNRLEEDFAKIQQLASLTFNQLSKNKHRLNDKLLSANALPADVVIANVEEVTDYNTQMEASASTSELRLQRLCTCCNRSMVFYDAVAESSNDAMIKNLAQQLLLSASERIAILKQALGKECGCIDSTA